jgi:hypothetical protein
VQPQCCSNCMRYFGTRAAMVERMVAHVKQADKAKAAALPRFDELCPPFRYSRVGLTINACVPLTN